MAFYRKKPVVIRAVQLPPTGTPPEYGMMTELLEILAGNEWSSERDEALAIHTLEGVMIAEPGDWIIRGVKGEAYPCKPDIFAAGFEPTEAPTNA